MPKTFRATTNRYIDDTFIDCDKNPVFTTSIFDSGKVPIPATLVELDPVTLKSLSKKGKKTESEPDKVKTLAEMNVKELKARAKELEMEIPGDLKKPELIMAIESFEEAGGSGDPEAQIIQDVNDPLGAGGFTAVDSIKDVPDPI